MPVIWLMPIQQILNIHAELKGLCLLFHEVVAFSPQSNQGVDNVWALP
jgi:hypothetical protein